MSSGVILAGMMAAVASAGDWTSWRGPFDTGFAPESAVVTEWSPGEGKGLLWMKDFGGRNTPVVHQGRVFFNCPVGEDEARGERMVCLDANTGELIWERRFNVFHTDIAENRVGWTSAVVDPETGNVYCHGTGGELFCWTRDGELVWKRSLTEEFGRVSGYGGRLMNPIVDGDQVVISFLAAGWGTHARGMHRYHAFDKRTGEVRWVSTIPGDPLDTTYAMPVPTVINGVRQLVCAAADGAVHGLRADNGEVIWSFKLNKRGLNTTPVVDGSRVYVTHSEENHIPTTEMGTVICIDGSRAGDGGTVQARPRCVTESATLWRLDGLGVGYSSPALANGRLYVVTNHARLYAIDPQEGRVIWEHPLGRVGRGSPVVTADGVIYVGEQNGILHILRDAGEHCEPLSVHEFSDRNGAVDEFFGSPAVAGGRVYFMTRYNTYCLGTENGETPRFEVSRASPVVDESDRRPLLTPAEVTVAPGEELSFRLSNASGGEWSVAGVAGAIDANGVFTAATANRFSAGLVKCTVDGRELTARIRVSPKLPIEDDFGGIGVGATPPGWTGCAAGPVAKLVGHDLDGERVLRKVAARERPSPPFMRLQTYFTPPLEAGYTVQCDMLSRQTKIGRVTYTPDMGLVNARYVFIMQGSTQRETRDGMRGSPSFIRLHSWGDLPRIRHDEPIEWQPDTWYTVKLDVRPQEDGTVLARAKFWPRGESEPSAWQIEVVDRHPNLEGSAGLYAYSTGTQEAADGPETYFDNLRVYRDE